MSPSRSVLLLALLAAPGCHPAPPRPGDGGPVLVASSIGDGATDVTRVPTFVLWFDRPLAPTALADRPVALVSGDLRFPLALFEDPTTSSLEVRSLRRLDPHADYRLEVGALRDLDGFESEPFEIVISTGRASIAEPIRTATYEDVAPIFAVCVRCHGGAEPTMGMDLGSPEGLRATVLDEPAREVATSGVPRANVSGLVGLSRIQRFRPERSYLLYKLVGDPHVLGAPMPFGGPPLDPEDVATIVAWIRAGAPLPEAAE